MPDVIPLPSPSVAPILREAEAEHRVLLLAELQDALAADGIHCVLARNHRLVLRANPNSYEPSGQTNPQLHVFAPAGTVIATTDGTSYSLASGEQCPASDPAAAATLIRHRQPATPQA